MITIFFLFILLALIPFIPAILETIKRKDVHPLPINLNFSKDPDYFGRSFWKILTKALYRQFLVEDIKHIPIGNFTINLSKKDEEILITDKDHFNNYLKEAKGEVDKIILCKNSLILKEKCRLYKEFVVNGDLKIEKEAQIRALFINGKIFFQNNTEIARWIHAEDDIYIESFTNLGISVFTKNKIFINENTNFKRIYAKEINIAKNKGENNDYDTNNKYIYPIKGSFKATKDINILTKDEFLILEGDIISDKDITIQGKVWIKGNIFSQGTILLRDGVIVGEKGKIKSVIAKKSLVLEKNIKIYGYILTEGEGKIII